jgi:hypothetical protein
LFQLFVDREQAIVRRHTAEWIDYSSSSSTSTGRELRQFAVGQPVILKREYFEQALPGFRHTYNHIREELSNKGSFAWIAPTKMVHPPLPRFVTPKNLGRGIKEWGFRTGIRIRLSRFFFPANQPVGGVIQIIHPGVRLPKNVPLNQLAIKLKVDAQSGYANSTAEPGSKPVGNPGLELTTSDSELAPQNSWQAAAGVISEDGNTLQLFVHPESFANGARPIIEVRFDAQYPNRVGFRIHQGAGSANMSECLLSSMDGSFALLRRIHFTGDRVETTRQLFPQWTDPAKSPADPISRWQTFSGDQFPLVEGDSLRRAKLTSDVSAYAQVQYPAAIARGRKYEGLPAQQSWLFPAETSVTVALRARRNQRNGGGLIPGGPALEDFEVRAPLQTWIWYEVIAAERAVESAERG